MASFGFGLITAAVLAIAAVGFTLQFAVTDVLNLAFGAVMIDSAFVAYALNRSGVSVWISLVAGVVGGALISWALNRFIYAPFQRKGLAPIVLVIVSLGVALILEFGLQAIISGSSDSYQMSQGRQLSFLSMTLSVVQIVILCISAAVMVVVHLLLKYTRLGKAMRATAANRNLARNSGIKTERVVAQTWILSGALCGLAGTVFAINAGTFGATSAELFIVLILAAVFLGGPGEPYGAMLGAVIIGLGTEISAAYISAQYKDVVAFVILLGMLAVRPYGIFGSEKTA
jgi:branched-chain amino acid transport system permease protein/neutral amino acid transport system permease protein